MKEFTKFIDINDNLLAFIIFSEQNNKKIIIGELTKNSNNNNKQIIITEIDLVEYKSFLYNLWLIQKENREKNIKLDFDDYKEMIQDLKDNFPYKFIIYSNLDSHIDSKEFIEEVNNFIKRSRKKYQFELLEISPLIVKNIITNCEYSYILFGDNNSIQKIRKCDKCYKNYLNLKQGQYWDYFQCQSCKSIKKINDFIINKEKN